MLHPVQLFKTLSDETRLSIVMLLREAGELCVCDLCSATNEPQPKVSRHMALLREAGLPSTVARVSGSTTVSLPTCLHGRQPLSTPAGTACEKRHV